MAVRPVSSTASPPPPLFQILFGALPSPSRINRNRCKSNSHSAPRSVESASQSPAGSADAAREMKRCMLTCGLYAGVSVAAVVTEVFALLALQFCDGEDLMPLYWAAWTALQVGALIAILGILLAASHSVRGREHP